MIPIDELQDQCDALTELYGLAPHRVVYDGRKHTGAHNAVEYRVIVMSPHMTDSEVGDVLRHELAHAKVWQDSGGSDASHGDAWKETARLMGAIPVACSAPITPQLAAARARGRRRRTEVAV